jgi:hypothetical protein
VAASIERPSRTINTDVSSYEFEMGFGKPPKYRPLLENPNVLVFAWAQRFR